MSVGKDKALTRCCGGASAGARSSRQRVYSIRMSEALISLPSGQYWTWENPA